MSHVKLISITPKAEEIIAFCSRVSSSDQENPNYEKLLNYCWKHGHVSIFEQASMTVEIITNRAISAQLLRHKSFCFQEFSLRYQQASPEISLQECRLQDTKNRQNSLENTDNQLRILWEIKQRLAYKEAMKAYTWALQNGIAKEVARAVLPLATETKLYMTGNIRSWITYLLTRTDMSTQKEHRLIAEDIKENIFKEQLPVVYKAVFTG